MKCLKCGGEMTKTSDDCMSCHVYDTKDYRLNAIKPPRVVALEAQNAEMLAMLEEASRAYQSSLNGKELHKIMLKIEAFLIKKVEGENGK